MAHQMPQVGDTVRVVLEGRVEFVESANTFYVGTLAHGNSITSTANHVKSVEVIAPPAKVGDTVRIASVHKTLPTGTVVRYRDDNPLVKFADGLWRDPVDGFKYTSLEL